MHPVGADPLRQISVQPDQQTHARILGRRPQPQAGFQRIRRAEMAEDDAGPGRQAGRRLPRPGRSCRVGEEEQRGQGTFRRADSRRRTG